MYELIFKAPDYKKVYYEDKYSGNRSSSYQGNLYCKDEIYIANIHIAIDCALGYGGKVGCIRLDDFKCFYSIENGDDE